MTPRANPKFDTSIFYSFADLGWFFDYALLLIVIGVVLVALSFAFPMNGKRMP